VALLTKIVSQSGSKTGYPEPFSEYCVVNALYTLCIIRVYSSIMKAETLA